MLNNTVKAQAIWIKSFKFHRIVMRRPTVGMFEKSIGELRPRPTCRQMSRPPQKQLIYQKGE